LITSPNFFDQKLLRRWKCAITAEDLCQSSHKEKKMSLKWRSYWMGLKVQQTRVPNNKGPKL